MNPFDKIIGYEAVKQELIRIADVLAHPDAYAALGVSAPKGLLLHGDPGVGKTLMVNSLIEASGLPSYVFSKLSLVSVMGRLVMLAVVVTLTLETSVPKLSWKQ